MKFDNLEQDKGVAGLTILLSLVTMLFVIGLLVMIYALMGGELADTDSIKASESSSVINQSIAMFNSSTDNELTQCASAPFGAITSIDFLLNNTANTTNIASGNYSFSGCLLSATDDVDIYNNSQMEVSYTYSWAGAGFSTINDTTTAISSVTDWFDIFIVIGAMVVLILLTVIIITAIRSSGMMGDQGYAGRNVGSA